MPALALRGPLRALALPRFAAYWGAQTLSVVADSAYLVTVAVELGVVRHSPGVLSAVLAANAVCFTVPMLVGGALVDRVGGRRIVIAGDVVRGAAALLLAVTWSTGTATAAVFLTTAAVMGLGEALFYPAFATVIPELVPTDRLASANSLRLAGHFLGSTLGPLFVLVALEHSLAGAVFWAQAGTFLVAAVAGLAVPRAAAAAPEGEERPGLLREAIAGARAATRERYVLRLVTAAAVVVVLISGPRLVLLPLHAADRDGLAIGTAGFAWLAGAGGVGALAGALYWGRREPVAGERARTVATSLALVGLGFAVCGGDWAWLAIVGIAIAGFGIGGLNVLLYSVLQLRVAPAQLGRTMAFVELAQYAAQPISFLLAGALVGRVASGTAIGGAGLGIVAMAGVVGAGWLRSLDE